MTSIISFPNPVNEKTARVVAAGVLILAIVTLATQQFWIPALMAVGFALRVMAGPRFSPLGMLANKVIAPRLGAPKLVAGPPKRFAQAIGLTFTIAAAVTGWGFGLHLAASVVMAVLLVFAFLESVVGFCAGCWVFGRLMQFGLIPESTCEACAKWSPTDIRLNVQRL